MLRKLLLVMASLTLVCLFGIGESVEAQADCSNPLQLSLSNGSASGGYTTDLGVCYQVGHVSSAAVSFSLEVSVTSGSVNIYWAAGEVTTLSRRLNAQKDLRGIKKFVPAKKNYASLYTLAIVPVGESTFSFKLKALEPVDPSEIAVDPCAGNSETCSAQSPLDLNTLILDNYQGAEVTYPIDVVCPSSLSVTAHWEGSANDVALRLEDERGEVVSTSGGSGVQLVYNTLPEDLTRDNVWQLTLRNLSGGSVNKLNVRLEYPPGECEFVFEGKESVDVSDITIGVGTSSTSEQPPAAVPTQIPPRPTLVPRPTAVVCPNSLPARMLVGGYGIVLPGDPNILRPEPTTGIRGVGLISAGDRFYVLGGPVCADNYTWWNVEYNGAEGWTAESGDGQYWIEPER